MRSVATLRKWHFKKSCTRSAATLGVRYNPLGIEMIPDQLHKQVFGIENHEILHPNRYNLNRCIEHLKRHHLLPKQLSEIDTIYEYHKHLSSEAIHQLINIPDLEGRDIDQHFDRLGKRFSHNYKQMACDIIQRSQTLIKAMPDNWTFQSGWTRYEPLPSGGYKIERVPFPLEKTLIFDVETCMNDSVQHAPTLAVALSDTAWYSWTSHRLTDLKTTGSNHNQNTKIKVNDLIPFNSSNEEKLIIGHNVSFDRSFLQDQYALHQTGTKFLDTLSLHMCICGLTGLQRALKTSHNKKLKDGDMDLEAFDNVPSLDKGSLNNLADVYRFHCGGEISKDDREVFVKGTMNDVHDNFNDLMTYCAKDVAATFEVFQKLFPKFNERFPHPVTLAGMLEMSTMYLPVNTKTWSKYIEDSQAAYDEYERQLSESLQDLANKACSLSEEESATNVWLWDLDRSTQSIKPNKSKFVAWVKEKSKEEQESQDISNQVDEIYNTKSFMRQINPFLPGFPKWYRDLCCPHSKASTLMPQKDWLPGPCLISTQMRVTPKLMQLTWNGYPLHYTQEYGWGYLVPDDEILDLDFKLPEGHPYEKFPFKALREFCKDLPKHHVFVDGEERKLGHDLTQARIDALKDNTQPATSNIVDLLRKISKKKKISPRLRSDYREEVDIPGAYFIKIPHKNGPNYNVGNPLAKDFISKMEDGTLSSPDTSLAKLLIRHSLSLSYWKNNHKRIKNQMVVRANTEPGGAGVTEGPGAILPRVIVSGTVTRRAVEPTWLTASNQDTTRIGSELKAMIQAPEGYCFVGADVDSQELWIASLMGDAYSYKIHGGTGLSYMTLRGSKNDNTDMHSKTASLIGISRSDAKVLNYARIYGAGQKFIERFLMNMNQQLNEYEAKEKAKTIYKTTKGVRKYFKSPDFDDSSADGKFRFFWEGGTESATFNKLEEIASAPEPRTPVLNCQISQALEPEQDKAQDFVTSRVNWVVQSSAVDFLHLILVNMKWLFERLDIQGRFSISIHDEVRYLVREEDRYKAAFALQVTNLLVRAYFAYKLGMRDLPMSVAFFSSVDVDKCLRKEVTMECKSPSNPLGLTRSHNIAPGESLTIEQLLSKYQGPIDRPTELLK